MCDEINSSCPPVTPPWEPPQVIPAQMRRVNNLIFRKINQFHRENEVEDVTPMHEWILSYLFWHRDEPIYRVSLLASATTVFAARAASRISCVVMPDPPVCVL